MSRLTLFAKPTALAAVLLLTTACATLPSGQEPQSTEASWREVSQALDETSDLAMLQDTDAVAAWARAYDIFERRLEPALRDEFGSNEVAELEFAFGQLRRSITQRRKRDTLADPERLANELRDQLSVLVSELPTETLASR